MMKIIQLEDPSEAQLLWGKACQSAVDACDKAGVDVSSVILIPLHEGRSISQMSEAGPWGRVVSDMGMSAFGVQNRVVRSSEADKHIETFFVCLFREPLRSADLYAPGAGSEEERAELARGVWVAHELAHCWQESRGFDFALSGLSSVESEPFILAREAIEAFLEDPRADPRPPDSAALEAAFIFEEFCSDVIACELMGASLSLIPQLLEGLALIRLSRSGIEGGRYQHGKLLREYARERPLDLEWSQVAPALTRFCSERASEFLAASQSSPIGQLGERVGSWRSQREADEGARSERDTRFTR